MSSDPAATLHREETASEPVASHGPVEPIDYLKSVLPNLQVKDWLVGVPLLASCIAIAYELGSFFPLGSDAFALFSLSDHVLWAISVLPAALFGAAGGLAGLALVLIFERKQSAEKKQTEDTKGFVAPRFKIAAFMLAVAIMNLLLVLYVVKSNSAIFALSVLITFLATLLVLVPEWVRSRTALTGAFLLLALLSFVFAWGSDTTSSTLDGRRISTFDFGGGNVRKAILVRSGEHGLLIYDPANRELTFTKMEELKNLKWQRRRLPWEDNEKRSKTKS